MGYILATLLSYLLLYKYVAVAVIVFLSGLLLPLPSNTLLLAAGAFGSQGYLNVWTVFAVALVSNVLGDSLGYMLTRVWGTRVITREHIQRFKAVSKIEEFVRGHVRLTILATRFIGTPGVVVNFLCGLSGVPYCRFVLYDAIGNALDTGLFIASGYMLGTFSEDISDVASLLGWAVLVAFLIYVTWKSFIKKVI